MLYFLFVISTALETTTILIPMVVAALAIARTLKDTSPEADRFRTEQMIVCLRGLLDQIISTLRRFGTWPA
jgi:hypothetical protein